MLSVSNHEPFKYPPGRIPEDPNARVREHAVKYTDYAIGRFFEAAKKERFWTNTVFVVVADHGARVYGSETIPMKSYEIPFLVLGPSAVQHPKSIGMQGGQVDIAPTILGLIGRPYRSGFFGRDLFQIAPETGRSFLNHNRDIGLYSREALVVLGLNKTVEYYEGNPKRDGLRPVAVANASEQARETEADAVALFEVANDIYLRDGFRDFDRSTVDAKSPALTADWRAAQ
jgi:phosphoglycerol transferase MdoB-like AlkP superfamily enzyme